MRYLYTFVLYLALPLILLRLKWKARRAPAYSKRWKERFGFYKSQKLNDSIWFHTVSYGEAVAALPLIKKTLAEHPDKNVVVTTMTPTGSDCITKNIGDSVHHVYIPYDFPSAIKRFIKHFDPKIAVIMETELWPNLLHFTYKKNIPILLANARLSIKSMKGYQRISKLIKPALNKITTIAAQSKIDAKHFTQLGVSDNKIIITGNIKYDLEIPVDITEQSEKLRNIWGSDRLVWIAASTHQGEDEKVLTAFKKILITLPNTLLLLVPRHPERFEQVAKLCQQQGFNTNTYSNVEQTTPNTQVIVGDVMGKMLLFYSASNVAFVGGSLANIGGHNPIEPASLSVPVVTGPHTFNFTEISHTLKNAGAMFEINNEEELADKTLALLQDQTLAKEAGESGLEVVKQSRGALSKHLKWIDAVLD